QRGRPPIVALQGRRPHQAGPAAQGRAAVAGEGQDARDHRPTRRAPPRPHASKVARPAEAITLDVDLEIQENVPLAPLSTIGVGGIARYYTRATHPEAVAAALRWAAQRSLPVFVLGGGSNVIIADEGHAGLVLHVALRGVEAHQRDGEVDLRVAAGESWDELVAMAVGHGWAGT